MTARQQNAANSTSRAVTNPADGARPAQVKVCRGWAIWVNPTLNSAGRRC